MKPISFIRALISCFVALLVLLSSACAPGASVAPTSAPTTASVPAKATSAVPTAAPGATAVPKAEAKPAPKVDPSKPLFKIKAAMNMSAANAPFFIGVERGYYKEQGVDVELIELQGGSDTIPPLSTGEILIGVGAISAGVFNAVQRNIPIKMVAASNVITPGFDALGWMVRKDLIDSGQVKEIKDLKGRKIALSSRASAPEELNEMMLAQGGLTPNDVEFINLGQPDQIVALGNKSLDVAFAPEPHMTNAEQKGVGVVWKTVSQVVTPFEIGAINMSPYLWQKNPDMAKAFMVAHLKAMRAYVDAYGPKQKDRDEVDKIIAKYTGVKDLEVMRKQRPVGINPDGYVYADAVERDLNWYISKGLVKPMKITDIVDNSFVDYAISVLGRYQP